MNTRPLIIMGAPRSGTNLLRDLLSQHPKIDTWDCDEINPIWKYGNYNKTDELSLEDLTDKSKSFIREEFASLSRIDNVVLEKTCANSLRPEFVHEIFPEARFIYIYRNGYDCSISARKKSSARFDISYQFKKLKYAPIASYPYLIYEKLFTAIWGPQYKELKRDLKELENYQIMAKQWMKCNLSLLNFFSNLGREHFLEIDYDGFVASPQKYLAEIIDFIELQNSDEFIFNTAHVFQTSIGSGSQAFSSSELLNLSKYIDPVNLPPHK